MIPALAWARVHISQVSPLHSQASLHQQIVLQWPSWEQTYSAVLDLTGRLPPSGEGGGEAASFAHLLHPPRSLRLLCRPQSQQLANRRAGAAAASPGSLAVPQNVSHMLLHTSAPDRAPAPRSPPTAASAPSQNLVLYEPRKRWGRNIRQKGGEGIRHNPERVENDLESTCLFSPTSSSLVLEATQLSNGNFRHPWASEATFSTLK